MIVYLDTSNLVKLFVDQEGFKEVRQLVEDAGELETSVVTYPEARSAFARLSRERRMPQAELDRVSRNFERAWGTYTIWEVDEALAFEAGELAERYRLSGCDSVHLACYARLLRASAAIDVQFSSSDVRLSRAAQALASRLAGVPPPWLKSVRPGEATDAVRN